MAERSQLVVKKPEIKRDNFVSKSRKLSYSQLSNLPTDRILFLQRTIGNQTVQRLIKSGALQQKVSVSNFHIQQISPACKEELQRQPMEEEEEEKTLQIKRLSKHVTPLIQRQAGSLEQTESPDTQSVVSNILRRRNSHTLMAFEANDEFMKQTHGHVYRKEAGRTNPCGPFTTPYTVQQGDVARNIARAHGTTVSCLRRMNPSVNLDRLQIGQSLNVPTNTCSLQVPTSADEQVLSGVVFAEAMQTRTANDERNAIASVFVNRINHVRNLCSGTICPSLGNRRRQQCTRDTTDFGATLFDAVKTGSIAYGGAQWNKVMDDSHMRSSAEICRRIHPGELAPLLRAIAAAHAMVGHVGRRRFVALNQASNNPPSPRMQRVVQIGVHTFYRFIGNRVCG